MSDPKDLLARRSQLSPAKQALLEKRLRGKSSAPKGAPTSIPRRATLGSPPLSFAQQRLWFLEQFQPGKTAYTIPIVIALSGNLDIPALEDSINQVIDRHEALRTNFLLSGDGADNQPVQVIHPTRKIPLKVFNLQTIPADLRQSAVQQSALEQIHLPFDLAQDALLRAALLCIDEHEYILVLSIHHIVFDGWSIGVFFNELSTFYSAAVLKQPASLAELPIQYADFAIWQQAWLKEKILDEQLTFWKGHLLDASGNLPPAAQLPTDRPRPPSRSNHGAVQHFTLPASTAATVANFSQSTGVTPYMTLIAAFFALLHRYTAQDDLRVGAPIANRNHPEIEGLIGFFVNTLVLRCKLNSAMTFRQLLAQVRQIATDAYDHQDLPFEQLVQNLNPSRDLDSQSLFQTMFVLQNAPLSGLKLPGLQVQPLASDPGTTMFDLTFILEETEHGLQGACEYSLDIFEASTIQRLVEHYQILLHTALEHPDQPLWSLELLTPDEQAKILHEWTGTQTAYPREASVHELFEEQARLTPGAVALQFEGQTLTYAELNQRANQLAHYLIATGVGAESRVAVRIERSFEMIIALLAILKAGGAYVPIDPVYPQERQALLIADTQPEVLLTRLIPPALASGIAGGAAICNLDAVPLQAYSMDNPNLNVSADNLAYIIYTSGSTGIPKGAAIQHRSIVRLVRNTNYASLTAQETFLQFATLSFDASTLEIWGALLNGAKLVIFPPHLPTLQELAELIQREKISFLWLTAGMFHQVVDLHLEALASVRQVLAGGDILSPHHVHKLLQALPPGHRLINGYGPTENTTFTCCYPMAHPNQVDITVSIGQPISNTRVYILDRQLQPVPIGVFGELYIAGDGLARGYWQRPELTAEAFIPNPYPLTPGERLYHTGDIVRYLADGRIEFSGRADFQVKIRGFRVELGEIEAILGAHPAIQQCIVIARSDQPGDKKLVAYIVLKQPDLHFSSVDLNRYLHERLPDYMLPAAYVHLPSFPLNANGKVERSALPAPEIARRTDLDYPSPRSPLEAALAAIWAEILGLGTVAIDENFFELGGHSLLAMRLIGRIRSRLGIELPVRALFEAPTVAALAEAITTVNSQANAAFQSDVPSDQQQTDDREEFTL